MRGAGCGGVPGGEVLVRSRARRPAPRTMRSAPHPAALRAPRPAPRALRYVQGNHENRPADERGESKTLWARDR